MHYTKADVHALIIEAMLMGLACIAMTAVMCFVAADFFNLPVIWGIIAVPIGYWFYTLYHAILDW